MYGVVQDMLKSFSGDGVDCCLGCLRISSENSCVDDGWVKNLRLWCLHSPGWQKIDLIYVEITGNLPGRPQWFEVTARLGMSEVVKLWADSGVLNLPDPILAQWISGRVTFCHPGKRNNGACHPCHFLEAVGSQHQCHLEMSVTVP